MKFEMDEAQLRALAKIEEDINCDISAGVDLGLNLGSYLAQSLTTVSHDKLMGVLQESLGNVLSIEEIEEVALSFQQQLRNRVMQKMQSIKSA